MKDAIILVINCAYFLPHPKFNLSWFNQSLKFFYVYFCLNKNNRKLKYIYFIFLFITLESINEMAIQKAIFFNRFFIISHESGILPQDV